jgi:dephospho-CoA kinase
MKWIGLTGGIATGKSTVSELLKASGQAVIDADQIARTVVQVGSPGLKAVVTEFGPEILSTDGSLDRKKMGQLVFGKPEKLAKLEAILHPLIKVETAVRRKQLEEQKIAFAFYDVPLLFEKNMEADFDFIVLVEASPETQQERMKARDGLSDHEISNRLSSQLPMAKKVAKSNYVIHNHGSTEDLKLQVSDFLQKLQAQKI